MLPPAHSGVHSMNLSHYANKPICQFFGVIQGCRMKKVCADFFLDLAIDIGKPNHEEFLLLPSHQNNEERMPQFSLIM